MAFEIGQVVGDYEILGELGKGGMGRVYRVCNVISNRVEAMKVLLTDVVPEAEVADRFIGEIRTLARLEHPNIAKLHTAFKADNQLVMIMECVDGITLAEQAKQGRIPLSEVLSYITQILTALSYAHENGVIHRDIKPSNAMITPQGVVKLMDFGIAKSTADPLTTRSGATIGSILYMSPEQVRGGPVDARSDLYSVGVLLYELTAGCRPFEGENTFAILDAQLKTVPQPPIELNPSLPAALNEIIMTALAKEPAHRFQSAAAFRNALQNVREPRAAAQTATLPYLSAPPLSAPGSPNPLAGTGPAAASSHIPPRNRYRTLWMASGAIACICVLAGAAVVVPHFWKTLAANPVISSNSSAKVTSEHSPPTTPLVAPVAVPDRPLPQNKTDNGDLQVGSSTGQALSPAPQKTVHPLSSEKTSLPEAPGTPQLTSAPPPNTPSPEQPSQAVAPANGPSQEELEKLSENLIQLQARTGAVNGSLDRLRQQQAASGFGLRQDIAASASRLDTYLQTAERALQSNDVQSARKNMDRASQELNKLEAFFEK